MRYRRFRHDDDELDFAEPGGRSALRADRKGNPRNLPCPNTCADKNEFSDYQGLIDFGEPIDRCTSEDETELSFDELFGL